MTKQRVGTSDKVTTQVWGPDQMLTSREVAEKLRLHVNTVKRLGDRGELSFFRVSRRGDRRYLKADVEAYLQAVTSRHTVSGR